MIPAVALFILSGLNAMAQDLTGEWEGKIENPDNSYDYTLYLKRINDTAYYGISVIRQKMKLVRNGYLSLGNATEKRPKYIKRLIGRLEGGRFRFAEFLQLEPEIKNYKPYSATLRVGSSKNKTTLTKFNESNAVQYELVRSSEKFPSEYVQYEIPPEGITIESIRFENKENTGKVKFNDVGNLFITLKNNLGIAEDFKVSIDITSGDSGIVSKLGNVGYVTVGDKPDQVKISNVVTGFFVPADSIHFIFKANIEGFTIYTRNFALPTSPFLKTKNVAINPGSASRLKILSAYYGFNNTHMQPVNRMLDSAAFAGDKTAMMWSGIFQYLGRSGYVLSEKAGKDKVKMVYLSSTVGSEAWNSRDLKSRPH